jgi:hypothetical protein
MRLQSVSDCSAALALLLREWRSGLLDSTELSRAANALSLLSRMITDSDLEARLEALEAAQAASKQPHRRVA